MSITSGTAREFLVCGLNSYERRRLERMLLRVADASGMTVTVIQRANHLPDCRDWAISFLDDSELLNGTKEIVAWEHVERVMHAVQNDCTEVGISAAMFDFPQILSRAHDSKRRIPVWFDGEEEYSEEMLRALGVRHDLIGFASTRDTPQLEDLDIAAGD